MKNKFIPFYFPQLHQIAENDLWWGEGYTDWDRVKTSQPLNASHNQPRVPLNNNYYDQSEAKTLEWQIGLAKEYGIYGFNFYHYWFDGKLLLEKPLELFKKNDHDLGYCITWANETWSKRWDGKFNEVLIKQNHNKDFEEWEKHYHYLEQFFTDPRYIKVNNKPVFMIYRPDIFPDVYEFIKFFNQKAIESGLEGLHFVAIRAYEVKDETMYDGFDAMLRFQPRDLFGSDLKKSSKTLGWVEKTLRSLPEQHQLWLGDLRQKFQKSVTYDFDEFWQHLLKNAKNDLSSRKEIYQSILPDWDNTARYGKKSKYFTGVTSEKFEKYLTELLSILETKDNKEKLIFINAWNEWSEGAYLEPDTKNGFKSLEILKRLSKYK